MRWIVSRSLHFRWIVLFLAGTFMAFSLSEIPEAKVDVFPEFAPPQIEIQTIALGNSTSEVESMVTVPIEEALADGPVGDARHLHEAHTFGRDADLHDPARRRQRRHHPGGAGPRRQGWRDLREALLHELARLQLVRAAFEDQPDRGQLGDRLGAQLR